MWTRLLVLGRDHEEVAAGVRSRLPGLDVRGKGFAEVRPADLADREMLLTFRIPDALRGALASLRWVQSTGAGVDALLGAARSLPPSILLTRLVGVFEEPMAEYVLARCLAFAQRMPQLERDRAAGRWQPFFPRRLRDWRATVLGAGAIGGAVARRLAAHGMDVTAVNRSGAPVPGCARTVAVGGLDAVLARTDVLVIVLPRTEQTENLVDARRLDLLPRGALVVNVARGAVIDENALIGQLADGRLGGAALDVFREEPLPPHSRLWRLENVLLSPHVAGLTTPADAVAGFCDNWQRLARGEEPTGRVDPARGY